MSKVGKAKIILPTGVSAETKGGDFFVQGPKGKLSVLIFPNFKVEVNNNEINVFPPEGANKSDFALWGTLRALINNAVVGVSVGYSKKLIIEGVGYKATLDGRKVVLNLGFSHVVNFPIPEGIEITAEKNNLTISGIDKDLVGRTSANLRALKKPEPYKGKGIRYSDEILRRKAGKKSMG